MEKVRECGLKLSRGRVGKSGRSVAKGNRCAPRMDSFDGIERLHDSILGDEGAVDTRRRGRARAHREASLGSPLRRI